MKRYLAIAAVALIALAGCNKRTPLVALLGDNTFVDGEATLTILLSEYSSYDVTVGLSYYETSSSSSKTLPGSALRFASPITINAGSTSAKTKVYLDEEGLADGYYHATIYLSYAQGADISYTNQTTIYVKIGQGDVPASDLTYMSGWSVALNGDPYIYNGKKYIDLIATVPGIKYFWVESNTDAELQQYYGGTVQGLLSYFSNSISSAIAGGKTIGEECWNASEANSMYAMYFGAGQTTFYIMEFDETGKSTGRYGTTVLTLPELEEDYFSGLTLVNKTGTWTVTYAGVQNYNFSDGTQPAEFLTVGGTGSVPFSFIIEDAGLIVTDDDLLSKIRDDYNDYYAPDVASGSTAADIYYTAPGTYCSMYQAWKGNYDAFVIGHDSETCLPTGEYAKCSFTDTAGQTPSSGSISLPRRFGTPHSAGHNAVKKKLLQSAR